MKIIYNSTVRNYLCALLILTLAMSCSQNLSYQQALNKNKKQFDDPKALADAQFLVDAKSFNLFESRLSEKAVQSGYSAAVVNMAKKSVEDHKELGEELNKLARKKKIKLPSEMSDSHVKSLGQLTATDREDFDKNYVRMLEQVNEENTYQFENMATAASDADIRAFSARKLGTLRTHAQAIDSVENKLLQTFSRGDQ
ncbi:DUF4142 domain-containing protein [Chryseosolibacter indicus]|uniref:DUF4142 domain-containing protein n=1 Tax=Chryseosolibacter indicus TaxID=2782351 RepID=A0ABS5VPN2_9BACT|nr:DUF4142 domain-containing protein [Chryseosolibacter indicus]MBT1703392.1 DUF4142 domain-containing protein [Chryseosolibacter indicus]